jgi:hypothetical protein
MESQLVTYMTSDSKDIWKSLLQLGMAVRLSSKGRRKPKCDVEVLGRCFKMERVLSSSSWLYSAAWSLIRWLEL